MNRFAAAGLAPLVFFTATAEAQVTTHQSEEHALRIETMASDLEHPWGLAFLPGDAGMLVTERPGRLRVVDGNGVSDPIGGVPEVDARGQGGLLDVAPHPEFEANGLIYLSYAEAGEGGNGTAVARGRLDLDAGALSEVEVVFRQQPKVASTAHFGSRLVFDNDGLLWITLGERSDRQFRVMAQDLDAHLGKVVRLNDDGSVPQDNPFVETEGALPEIWSYGHRNPQGAALHPQTGEVWIHEHGPRGGDEVNIPQAGLNYGWPVHTDGVEYSGATIFEGDTIPEEFEAAIHVWTPSIAPSGMAFYTGDAFPGWQGDLFVGALAGAALHRLELDGDDVVHEERMLADLGERIRDVRMGPDGLIYLLTDASNGRILRLRPAE